ncbi:NAD(P)/FAD-dependent oxidoreductase [Arthrobacter crusticola]|uniref:NAD(P)/FAD-dependent oxidoreductase n=1 Tax=Arthrobacter crusticola TaxID=2547960 RepID=A0A4R5TWS7_9MICC|nr:NAD(P)/FAD-dependent oxidoreductase [Arthrobacter crusticola]TDK25615.1 NAD(P)/FAD-dependent oxidoreductase [Arthrobacter crusticola]
MQDSSRYDVIIIGGGAAGLSAAVALGRSLRTTAVIDSGAPRNAPAAGVHNFLSRDGVPPLELLAAGRVEAASYGAVLIDAEAVRVGKDPDGFTVTLGDGGRVSGRRLLVTTGLTDELPDVEGLPAHWGSGVIHCPYCHGYEARGKAIGVLATGPMAMHQVQMFRQLSSDVTLFLHTAPEPTDEEEELLAALSVRVVSGRVEAAEETDGSLSGVRLESGASVPLDALVVAPRFAANSVLLESLGVEISEHPMGIGYSAEVDPQGRTSVPGVWAAGNVADPVAQVMASSAAGLMAGAAINGDLIAEEAKAAVERRRAARGPGLGGAPAGSDNGITTGTPGRTAELESHAH